MTIGKVMDAIYEYASVVEDIAASEAVFAHIGKIRYADRDELLANICAAIKQLVADTREECAKRILQDLYPPKTDYQRQYNAGVERLAKNIRSGT